MKLLNDNITGRDIPCIVYYQNGKTEKRKFYNTKNFKGLKIKKSHKRYYPPHCLSYFGITTIELKKTKPKKTTLEQIKFNAKKFLKLSDSRLWDNLRNEIYTILNEIDDFYIEWKKQKKDNFSECFYKKYKNEWLLNNKVFITINTTFKKNTGKELSQDIENYLNGQNDNFNVAFLRKCINNENEKYLYFHKHYLYDNTIEVHRQKGLAWLSREYKNCGNGHYYLLISPTHAIYYEKD